MTTTRKIFTAAALAAGLMIGATGASFANPYYTTNNFAEHAPGGKQPNKLPSHLPQNLKCERGFYGETKCNISPNGRVYGPTAYDYATSTGEHIQR